MRVKLYVGDGIGNLVHALPTIQAIVESGHDLTVGVISSWPDAATIIDHDKVETGVGDDAGFDKVYCTAILPRLTMADGSRPFAGMAHPPHSLQETSEAEANFWIARQLGFTGPMPLPKIAGPFESSVDGQYIVIAPGFQKAGGVWRAKGYPHWKEAVALFDKYRIVFVGSAEDAEPWYDNHTNLCGKTTLRDLCGVLGGASAVVGVDNGPTALAAALGVKTVVLFGPTHRTKNRKYGPQVLNISADSVACRPCQFTGRLADCKEAKCMAAIPPEVVAMTVQVVAESMPVSQSEPHQYNAAWHDARWKESLQNLDGYYRKADNAHPEFYVNRNLAALKQLAPRKTDRILDMGCGGGFNIWLLRDNFGCENVVGLDFSPVAIEFCQHTYPWATFSVGSADTLPYADAEFDTVLMFDVTEHLPHDLYHRALAEVRRVLKPGGAVVVLPGTTNQPEHINLLHQTEIADDLAAIGIEPYAVGEWVMGRLSDL